MRVDLYRFGSKHNEVYVDKSRKRCYTVGDKKHFLPPINASNSKVGNSHRSSLNLQTFCCYNSYFRSEHSQNVLQCFFITHTHTHTHIFPGNSQMCIQTRVYYLFTVTSPFDYPISMFGTHGLAYVLFNRFHIITL